MGQVFRFVLLVCALAATLVLPGGAPVADGGPMFPLRPGAFWANTTPNGGIRTVMVNGPNRGGPGFEVVGYFMEFDGPRILQVRGEAQLPQARVQSSRDVAA